jgi:flagellar hook-length control protein FliK
LQLQLSQSGLLQQPQDSFILSQLGLPSDDLQGDDSLLEISGGPSAQGAFSLESLDLDESEMTGLDSNPLLSSLPSSLAALNHEAALTSQFAQLKRQGKGQEDQGFNFDSTTALYSIPNSFQSVHPTELKGEQALSSDTIQNPWTFGMDAEGMSELASVQLSETFDGQPTGVKSQLQAQKNTGSIQRSLSGSEYLNTLGNVQIQGLQGPQRQSVLNHSASFMSNEGVSAAIQNETQKNPNSLNGGKSIEEGMAQSLKLSSFDQESLRANQKKSGSSDSDPSLVALSGMYTVHKAPQSAQIVTANVVPGAMAQERISTDGLNSVTNQIRAFSHQGGGEMKVRLRPENLGELQIRVLTQGNQVQLEIHASSDKAKKILEESLSHLKDSLSAQQLTLSQIDLSVTPPSASAKGDETGAKSFDFMGQNAFGNSNEGFQRQSDTGGRDSEAVATGTRSTRGVRPMPINMGAASAQNRMVSNGRLDVTV